MRPNGLYLRDIIKRIQGEEQEAKHPTPQPDYKQSLERVLEALVGQCDQADSLDMNAGVTTQWIRQLVKQHQPR